MHLPKAVPPSLWLPLEPVKAQQDRPSKSAATTAEVVSSVMPGPAIHSLHGLKKVIDRLAFK